MENLLPLNDKFKGCELIFPDTVLFSKGKPTMIIRSDKDYCVTGFKGSNKKGTDQKNNKLSLYNLSSMLASVVRERKKDLNSVFS